MEAHLPMTEPTRRLSIPPSPEAMQAVMRTVEAAQRWAIEEHDRLASTASCPSPKVVATRARTDRLMLWLTIAGLVQAALVAAFAWLAPTGALTG